jgi:hypothetical protein
MTNKKTDQKIVSQGQAPIKWNIPEDITTHFASHMIVQQIEDYFSKSRLCSQYNSDTFQATSDSEGTG